METRMRIGVVGGGPAGSHTAELLATQGARVVLFEARSGWEKPCGGGIPERGIDFCPFLRDPALPQRRAIRARIYSPRDREALVPLAEPLRIYCRRDLNGFLLDRARKAGAEVRGLRVTGLHRDGKSWRVCAGSGPEERFEFLIGADGASGIVRGRVPGRRWPREQTVGLGYYLDGASSDEVVLKFLPDLKGYIWVFPRMDHLAAGICGLGGAGQGPALESALTRFLVDLYGVSILRHRRKYGALIPALPPGVPVRESCQGSAWALVGDAAGFVDPLTREGIHYSLASARFLADALAEGRPASYGGRCERTFGSELAWADAHRGLFFSSRFIEAFTVLTSSSPALQGLVSDLVAGRQSYTTLRRCLARRAPAAAGSLALKFLGRVLGWRPSPPSPPLTPPDRLLPAG